MRQQKIARRLIAAWLLVSTTACYAAHPLSNALPAPATRVTAELTDSGTVVMGGLIGSGATAIEGLVARADATSWDLNLLRVEHRDGRTVRWDRETVTFPRSVLTGATEKRFDATRSVIAGGLLATAVVLASYMFSSGGSDSGGEGGPVPPASRIPISLPFR